MQEASLAAAEPGRRPAQQHHQFAGVDLRRPKGYAAPAPVETNKVGEEGGGDPCPRCASRDTKFCYYNNYNTSQPRHFCKGCRRYWTKGGTLRNVPVGGGTRKKPSSSSYAAAADHADKPPKKKPASKKRRVVAPQQPEPSAADTGAITDPVAAADSAKTTTTTDGASEITTETAAAAAPAAALAAVDEDSDSLAHLLLQPGAEDAIALGLGLSDFPSAAGTKAETDDDSFQWPAAYDLGACWASAGFGASAGFVDQDPAGLFLNLP